MSCTSAFPAHLVSRVARHGPDGAAPPPPEPGSPLDRAIPHGVQQTAAFANRHDVLRADIPSQGTMFARAVARMYAALLGHIDDIELVSPERLATMATSAFSGTDQVVRIPTTTALGYSLARPGGVESRPGSTFGWVGSNGSAAYAAIDAGVAVAVIRSRIVGDMSAVAAIDRLVADSLG
jgi:Beta-lactamase